MISELRYLTPHQAEVLTAAVDRVAPALGTHPGAAALGAAHYIDRALGAFLVDPPEIWAGGPFSGRAGGAGHFHRFEPLSALEELAWRTRIEGSLGLPDREWNGPVRGWQEIYGDGLGALGDDFAGLSTDERDERLAAAPVEFRALLHQHVCEGCYGAPEYGGNDGTLGWQAIAWPGDTQPRGFTDREVSGRE